MPRPKSSPKQKMERIKVRYLEVKDEPSLVGTEDHVNEGDIEAMDLGC